MTTTSPTPSVEELAAMLRERDGQNFDGEVHLTSEEARQILSRLQTEGTKGEEDWRPEVVAFADLMEAQLKANDHKPGWKSDQPQDLWDRMVEEGGEVLEALSPDVSAQELGNECADVANFAMMIADVCGALASRPTTAEPVKMVVDGDWLRRKVEADPDLDTEATTAEAQVAEDGEATLAEAKYDLDHAEATIAHLTAQLAQSRAETELAVEAMKPFDRHGRAIGGEEAFPVRFYTNEGYREIPLEDFRRIRTALAAITGEKK